jgi:hypothetical protein
MLSILKHIRMTLMVSKSKRACEDVCDRSISRSMTLKSLFGVGAGALMAIAILAASTPVQAAAAQPAATDYFYTHFFDTSTSATYSMRVLNPERVTNPICAMVYVFDSTQTLQECCGCPLRSDQLETFGLANLTGNSFSPPPVSTGSIYVVSSAINHGSSAAANGGCDPTVALNPTPALRAWFSNDSQGISDPFLVTTLDAQEQNRLPTVCASSVRIGTPAAICACGQ